MNYVFNLSNMATQLELSKGARDTGCDAHHVYTGRRNEAHMSRRRDHSRDS